MNQKFENARKKYGMEASKFSSFNGSEMKDGFVGQTSKFVGQTSNADGANGFSQLADSNKTLTVVCQNTATAGADVTCVVFGAYLYSGSTQPNAGAVVTIDESSHAQVREQSKSQPFWVNGLRMAVSDATQLSKITQIQYKNPSGDDIIKKFRPASYRTASQLTTTQIDAPNYTFGVDGSCQMNVPVSYGQSVTWTLNIGGRFDASNLVEGTSPILVANQKPLNTGLVTVVQGN